MDHYTVTSDRVHTSTKLLYSIVMSVSGRKDSLCISVTVSNTRVIPMPYSPPLKPLIPDTESISVIFAVVPNRKWRAELTHVTASVKITSIAIALLSAVSVSMLYPAVQLLYKDCEFHIFIRLHHRKELLVNRMSLIKKQNTSGDQTRVLPTRYK